MPGSYTVSGTDIDSVGDSGSWSFTLTVNSATGSLTQGSPTSDTVGYAAGYSNQLSVTGNVGTVIYTQTSSDSPDLNVDGAGGITASASLVPGSYTVSGTDIDSVGDSGSWSFTLTVEPGASSTLVTDNSSGLAFGDSFTYTATVSGNGVTPTGTLTWMVTDPGGNPVVCAPSTLSAGVATCTVSDAVAGSYSATATYSGDSNYAISSGSDDTASVGATSSTTVFDDSAGVVVGGAFTYTATVSGGGVTPTGTVTWSVAVPSGSVVCAPSTLSDGVATCTVSDAIAGIYSATATYSGDSNYAISSGSDDTASVAVDS